MVSLFPRYRRHNDMHYDDLCFLREDETAASRSCISNLMGQSDLQRGLALARARELQNYRQAEQQYESSAGRTSLGRHPYNKNGYNYEHDHSQREPIHVYMFGDELAKVDTMASVASSSINSSSEEESSYESNSWCTTPSTIEVPPPPPTTTRSKRSRHSGKNSPAARPTHKTIISVRPLSETKRKNRSSSNYKNKNKNNKNKATVVAGSNCSNNKQAKQEGQTENAITKTGGDSKPTKENDDDSGLLTFSRLLYEWGGEVEEWQELLQWGDLANDTMDATKTCTTGIAKTPMMSKMFGPNRRDSKKERRSISSYMSWRNDNKKGGRDPQQQQEEGQEVSVDL